jgi:hypothetical protein
MIRRNCRSLRESRRAGETDSMTDEAIEIDHTFCPVTQREFSFSYAAINQ